MSAKKTVAKKVATPKAEKVAAPKAFKKAVVTLVSFEVTAVIPTMSYGNIQPKITVTAPSMDDAVNATMPVIERLYASYGEKPLTARVTVTEKIVETPKTMADIAPKSPEAAPVAPVAEVVATPAPKATEPATVETPEAVKKAEKAVSLAATKEAIDLIQGQIENSVKIPAEYKPALLALCIDKISSLAF